MRRTTVAMRNTSTYVIFLVSLAVLAWACGGQAPASPAPAETAAVTGAAASPSPTVAASPAPSLATSPATARLDDRFGFIVTSGSSVWLRPETDAQKRTTLTGRSFTASADGTQIAFWRDAAGTAELVVMPAARPDRERSVYKVPSGQQAAEIVWANDGGGVLVTVLRAAAPGSGRTVAASTLIAVDLGAANAATTLATLTDGRAYRPIAWDRTANVAAAVESSVTNTSPVSPTVEAYVTFKTGGSGTTTPTRTAVTDRLGIGSVTGSPDAKYVFGLAGADSVRSWPLNDYAAGGTFNTPGRIGRILWRPGTAQVAWVNGSRLDAYDVGAKSSTTLFREIPANTGTGMELQLFRVDGSAAVIGPHTVGPGQAGSATLIAFASGTFVRFDMGDVIGNGFILSVRLRQ